MVELNRITDETPLVLLTLGQLKSVLSENEPKPVASPEGKRYVYGLAGIAKLFNVSTVTAFRLKNGVIKEAVYQQGRTIVCDAEKALALFNSK